jgi:hypothetical protein
MTGWWSSALPPRPADRATRGAVATLPSRLTVLHLYPYVLYDLSDVTGETRIRYRT